MFPRRGAHGQARENGANHPFSLGKSDVLPETGIARRVEASISASLNQGKLISGQSVQNRLSGAVGASLLRTKMLMIKNNYPQTYPRVENMLVITNFDLRGLGKRQPQTTQRPRPEGLGAL